jgi:GTPase SAR1 family protein
MITIKKNKNIKLNIPSFTCDYNAVGEHLENHDLTKYLNCYGFLCVIGRPASGKTSMTIAMITQKKPQIYKKTHHHILLFMPENSINSLKKNPFEKLNPSNIYYELTNSSILDAYDKIDGWSKQKEKTLLYIDDMTSDLKKSKFIIDTLKKLIYNRRHLKLNIVMTAQVYPNLSLDIRKCITNLIMFKPPKKELERVFEELIESKKEIFDKVFKIIYNEPHNFLFLNVPSQTMFRNFDQIIIDEEDGDDD